MNVSIDQFRASIGLFNNVAKFSKSAITNLSLTNCVIDVFFTFLDIGVSVTRCVSFDHNFR